MDKIFNSANIILEFKRSIRLVLPMIATEIVYSSTGFISTIMVAHLGKGQMAANILVWSIYWAVIVFFLGILSSVSVMAAHSFGANDNAGVGICFKQGLIMAIIFSLPMMLIMQYAPIILVWTGQDPAVILYAKPFFSALIWTMLPLNILIVVEDFLVGITKTRLVMVLTVLSVPIGILFSYAFLFGKFGLPEIGLAGIGYGWTVSYSLVAICGIYCLISSKQFKIYALFKNWWIIDSKFLFEMIRIGLPMGFMWCSELVFFAIVAIMMGTLGTTVLAAYQISNQYITIALVILFALTNCVAVRVGNEVGKNNRDKLHLIVVVNMAIGLFIISMFSLFYLIFPTVAISIDIDINSPNFKDVAVEAVKFFPIISVLLISDCIRIISSGALRGLKDSNLLMLISMCGFWGIAFPSAYFLAFKLGLGGVGIWWGIVIGLSVTGIMFLLRFKKLASKVDLVSLVTRKDVL